jgi:hypothetical protein
MLRHINEGALIFTAAIELLILGVRNGGGRGAARVLRACRA